MLKHTPPIITLSTVLPEPLIVCIAHLSLSVCHSAALIRINFEYVFCVFWSLVVRVSYSPAIQEVIGSETQQYKDCGNVH